MGDLCPVPLDQPLSVLLKANAHQTVPFLVLYIVSRVSVLLLRAYTF